MITSFYVWLYLQIAWNSFSNICYRKIMKHAFEITKKNLTKKNYKKEEESIEYNLGPGFAH